MPLLLGLSLKYLFFAILMTVTAVFLILLVLVQRGRGGGLAGAFGGVGGQSAFGTKAGDLFTRITIGVAIFWLLLCIAAIKLLNSPNAGPLDKAARKSTAPVLPAESGTSADQTAAPAQPTPGPEAPAPAAAPNSPAAPSNSSPSQPPPEN